MKYRSRRDVACRVFLMQFAYIIRDAARHVSTEDVAGCFHSLSLRFIGGKFIPNF